MSGILGGGRGGIDRPLWWLPYVAVGYVVAYLGAVIWTVGLFGLDAMATYLTSPVTETPFFWTFVLAVAILVLEAGWRLAKRVGSGGGDDYHVE